MNTCHHPILESLQVAPAQKSCQANASSQATSRYPARTHALNVAEPVQESPSRDSGSAQRGAPLYVAALAFGDRDLCQK